MIRSIICSRGTGKNLFQMLVKLDMDIRSSGLTPKEYFARMNLTEEGKQAFRKIGIKAEILGIEEEKEDERPDNNDL